MLDFIVAIPTYNGANRLPAVLDKLKAQTGTDNRKSAKRVDTEIRISFWGRHEYKLAGKWLIIKKE